MRRRAVLVVEYGKESGRPIDETLWEAIIGELPYLVGHGPVRVEVQEDEPA